MQIAFVGRARLVASSCATVFLVAAIWLIPGAAAQSLPSGWSVADIGGPASPGSATFVSSAFTVTSRGFDVNGVADQFTFAYRQVSGDMTIIARLKTLPNVDPWAQAGLMIRRDLSADSKHVFVFGTPGQGVVVRTRTNGSSTSQTLSGAATVPVWLKLERRSQTLTAFRSNDGASWTAVRTLTLQISSEPLVGLAVASHSTSGSLTAAFDSVTVNGQAWVSPNVPPAVSLTSPANGSTYTSPASMSLAATATDADGTIAKVEFYAGQTLVGTDTTSPYAFNWTGVGAGTHVIKAVATDNAGASTTSATRTVTVSGPNVAPTVSMTTDKGSYTAPASVVMTAVAADSDGTVAKVDFYAGATLVGTDTSSPFTQTWTGVAAGSYALQAVATDNKGATTTSGTVNVTVTGAVSGLVGAWVGNDGTGTTLTDSSGNGRNGTISGATWVAGRVGVALNFTGSGVADLGDLDLPGAFTVMAWMQTRSLYAGTCGSLVMKAFDYGRRDLRGAAVGQGRVRWVVVGGGVAAADVGRPEYVEARGDDLRWHDAPSLRRRGADRLGTRRAHDDERSVAVRPLDSGGGILERPDRRGPDLWSRVVSGGDPDGHGRAGDGAQRATDRLADDTGRWRHLHGAGHHRHRGDGDGQRRHSGEGGILRRSNSCRH